MTDQTERPHASLLRDLDAAAAGVQRLDRLDAESAAKAIRGLEAAEWARKVAEQEQTESASEYDILCQRLAGWEHSLANEDSELVLNSIDAIRALEAKVREKDREIELREADNREVIVDLRQHCERLAGEVERLQGGVEFWRGSHTKVSAEVARLTAELADERQEVERARAEAKQRFDDAMRNGERARQADDDVADIVNDCDSIAAWQTAYAPLPAPPKESPH